MKEVIKLLDEDLKYVKHEIKGPELWIEIKSVREEAKCPYCGQSSRHIHSRISRKLKDLPIQGKKVILCLEQRKYFCKNKKCRYKTFAERFNFFDSKATKTHRLQEEILRVALTQSSVAASRYLRASVADVGKSTICNLVKKGRQK
jgi:transposase